MVERALVCQFIHDVRLDYNFLMVVAASHFIGYLNGQILQPENIYKRKKLLNNCAEWFKRERGGGIKKQQEQRRTNVTEMDNKWENEFPEIFFSREKITGGIKLRFKFIAMLESNRRKNDFNLTN